MTVAGFLTALSGKRMTGVDQYYSPANLPGRLAPDNLPGLILLYDDTYYDSLQSESVDQESYWYRIVMRHLLLIQYSGVGAPAGRFGGYAAFLDAYRTMLADDLFLAGNLARPLSVLQMQVGLQTWAGDVFVGIDWRLQCYVS